MWMGSCDPRSRDRSAVLSWVRSTEDFLFLVVGMSKSGWVTFSKVIHER